MRRLQRLCHVILAVWALTQVSRLPAQDHSLLDPEFRKVRDALLESRSSIDRKQFHSAVVTLQRILDRAEDYPTKGYQSSTRKEAQQILKSMPSDGLAAYEVEYGATARQLLTQAQEGDDLNLMADVARRYMLTSAGYDATVLLAAHAADANRPLEAALLLEPILDHPRHTPQLLLHQTVNWSRAGQADRAMETLAALKRSLPMGKVSIGGRDVALPGNDDAAKWLQTWTRRSVREVLTGEDSWTMAGGSPARNGSAVAASPVGGNAWSISTVEHLTLDGRESEDRKIRSRIRECLESVRQSLLEENQIAIAAAQPLVIGDSVVYRTAGDVTAVSLQSGELLWRSALVDESLVRHLYVRTFDARHRIASLESHLERRIYRDAAAGTLSSDGKLVFALEDLESVAAMNAFGETRSANKLVAYELAGGRMVWEVGGPRGSLPAELSALFFAGPPLPLDNKLYTIVEGQGVLMLLVLLPGPDGASVQIDWTQTLAAVYPPVAMQPLRRLSGLSPSYSDGVLVCPTSSGSVVAIDAARRSLRWGFQYQSLVNSEALHNENVFDRTTRTPQPVEEMDRNQRWLDSAPLIADGKVLLTPRDSDQLYCLDLVDGHEVWRLPRDDWMYVACAVEGRVILVGRHSLRAVQLADGKLVDSFGVDVEPTGRGVRSGMSYLLPLATGEIATIDLRSGRLLARSKLAGGRVPGNLAAGGGAIVSLGAGEVTAFSKLADIEKQIAQRLAGDPHDPQALALRGELRLHRGEEAAGLADLRDSLKSKPDPYVKSVLAASLLAMVRNDPAKVRESIAELEQVTVDPQQKNEYLRIYSKALEATGDRRGAFAQMIRLSETAQFLDDLEPVDSGYSVRTDRSIRARLIEMYSAASEAERADLDRLLEQRIGLASADGERAHLERCVQFFSGLPAAEAMLLKSIEETKGLDAGLKQQLLRPLSQSEDPAIAGRATALRGRELMGTEQWAATVPLILRLRNEFAERECLDGKTGRSLADEWSAKAELSRLAVAPVVWPSEAIDPHRVPRTARAQRPNLAADVATRSGSALAGWTFETDSTGVLLTARDSVGVQRWKLSIPNEADASDRDLRGMAIPCQVHIRDNWVVLVHLTYFVVIDTSVAGTPRVAWHQTLKTGGGAVFDQRGRRPRSIGKVIGITRDSVVYSAGSKLMASELETGRLAWSRMDALQDQAQQDGSVDERTVAIHSGTTVTLLRGLDGSRLVKRTLKQGVPLWGDGARQLLMRTTADVIVFELRDCERDVAVWTREFPAETLVTLVEDDNDLAFLEPSGKLSMVRWADGRQRYQTEIPMKPAPRDKSYFAVQRSGDKDIILAGETYNHRPGLQVIPFDSGSSHSAIPFDGTVSGVNLADGKLLWSNKVERAAFDRSQPSGLPVLLLAARQVDTRGTGNPFQQRFRMIARVIDKRNGREVYYTEEAASMVAPRLEPDPEHQRIVANFYEWQLDLTFPDAEKANARK